MRMGATHFLMKTLPKVATEMALHVLAYQGAYLASADTIKRQQLAKAGARLAELLNAIWP
jgi:hypothetical protein